VGERRIGASVVELMPFDLAASVDEVAQHRLGLLRRLAVDDVVIAEHDGGVLPFRLGEQTQRQHGVGILRAEEPAFCYRIRHALHIGDGHCWRCVHGD
jgi:hypothetical protein